MDHVWWPLGHLDAALRFLGNQRCIQDRELLDGMFVFLSAPSSVQTGASVFTWGAWQAKTFSTGWMRVPARRCETEAFGWFARISIDDNYGQWCWESRRVAVIPAHSLEMQRSQRDVRGSHTTKSPHCTHEIWTPCLLAQRGHIVAKKCKGCRGWHAGFRLYTLPIL